MRKQIAKIESDLGCFLRESVKTKIYISNPTEWQEIVFGFSNIENKFINSDFKF